MNTIDPLALISVHPPHPQNPRTDLESAHRPHSLIRAIRD